MCSEVDVQEMKTGDTRQVAKMILESNLGYWSKLDLEQELERNDSVVLVAKKSKKVVGFISARLIMSEDTDLESTKYHSKNNDINNENDNKINNLLDKQSMIVVEIYNIAVKKNVRRKKVGNMLVKQLVDKVTQRGPAICWLEVRESNVEAINFYKFNFFTVCYKRKNFYNHPNEDAIIMKLETENFKN